jgi:hypothetical protein
MLWVVFLCRHDYLGRQTGATMYLSQNNQGCALLSTLAPVMSFAGASVTADVGTQTPKIQALSQPRQPGQ